MYSPAVWKHSREPQNRGPLPSANAQGQSSFKKCGDSFQLELRIHQGQILEARFQARVCAPVVAMGSIGTQLLRGLTVEQARQLLPTRLDQALGGVPTTKRHAILMFLEALHQGLDQYENEENRHVEM